MWKPDAMRTLLACLCFAVAAAAGAADEKPVNAGPNSDPYDCAAGTARRSSAFARAI